MASVAEIEAHSSGRPVILSSETLCAAPMAKVTALDALFDPFDTRVVYYIRPQVPLFESAFRQFQRARLSPRHTAIRDVAAYFKARQDGFDFEKNLAPWEAVFGTEAISVRLYDRRTCATDICGDFADVVGLPEIAEAGTALPPANASLDVPLTRALMAFKDMETDADKRRAFRSKLEDIAAQTTAAPDRFIGAALARTIRAEYCESNARIAARYLNAQQAGYLAEG